MSIVKLVYEGCYPIPESSKWRLIFSGPAPNHFSITTEGEPEGLEEGAEHIVDTDEGRVISQAHLLKFYHEGAQELYDSIARKHPSAVAAELIKELQTFHDFWGRLLVDKAYEITAMYEDREQAKKALNAVQTYYAPIGGSSNAIKS